MTDHNDAGLPQTAELRREAEKRLRARESQPAEPIAEASARARVHELQVHQIELEMQNEEPQRARALADEASEKYHDLFDFAPVGYFLWDREGRILEVNMAGAALLGLGRGAVVNKPFGQFLATEHRATFAEFCQRVLATEEKQTCEVKFPHNGQVIYALVEGIAARDHQGQRVLCRAAVVDITERKRAGELAAAKEVLEAEVAFHKQTDEVLRRSEQRIRDVLNSLFAFVGLLTPDGTVVEANRPALDAASLKPADVLGKPFEECYWWSYSADVQAQLRAAIERGAQGELSRYDVAVRLGSGRYITIDFMLAPMRDSQGRISCIHFGSAVDATKPITFHRPSAPQAAQR